MYFVVDLEATCWEQKNVKDKNEIIEIGLVLCSPEGDILGKFQSFVRPIYNPIISKFCKRLTKIDQQWIDDADPLSIVIPRMMDWIRFQRNINPHDTPWAAFGSWDEICLRKDCDRHALSFPFGRFIDIKELYTNFGGCDQCGLKQAVKRENLVWEGSGHRALDDAINAVKLARFLVMDDIINIWNTEITEIEPPPSSS